jgi:hypothetical protein
LAARIAVIASSSLSATGRWEPIDCAQMVILPILPQLAAAPPSSASAASCSSNVFWICTASSETAAHRLLSLLPPIFHFVTANSTSASSREGAALATASRSSAARVS